jgi:uncharacterized membrane protein
MWTFAVLWGRLIGGGSGMKIFSTILFMLAVLSTFLSSAFGSDAPTLSFTFKHFSVPGGVQNFPGGINNVGVIVGQYQDRFGALHGYILDGKKLTTLDDPEGTSTNANNLSPDGAISVVGSYVDGAGASVGFIYTNGEFTNIPGPPGAVSATATSINDAGAITGSYVDGSGVSHGFLLVSGKYTTLDVPGASSTFATGINTAGLVVLYWIDSQSNFESSVYDGKTYKTLDVTDAQQSVALDIDTAGAITYEWFDPFGLGHGALWQQSSHAFYKFDYPNAVQTYAGGINDHSMIVGGFQAGRNGPFRGYIASYK